MNAEGVCFGFGGGGGGVYTVRTHDARLLQEKDDVTWTKLLN